MTREAHNETHSEFPRPALYKHNPDLGNGCSANGELAKKFGFRVSYVMAVAKAYMDRAQSQMAATGL